MTTPVSWPVAGAASETTTPFVSERAARCAGCRSWFIPQRAESSRAEGYGSFYGARFAVHAGGYDRRQGHQRERRFFCVSDR
jgi:hypothetical protein